MSSSSRLFRYKNPFAIEESNDLFLKAVKENCEYHYKNCPEYRQILDGEDFSPDEIKTYDDIKRIPFITTLFFKKHAIFSMPQRKMLIKATSSGTSGTFSRVGFDAGALFNLFFMGLHMAKKRGFLSAIPVRYIILGYRPNRNNKAGVAKSAYSYTFFAPPLRRTYALKYCDGKYVPDFERILKKLQKYGKSRIPTRFIGFPAYMFFLLKMLDENGIHYSLPRRSIILVAGGWKQFYREEVNKEDFYALAKKVLDIDDDRIIEAYGAVEHPVFYCDCPNHHFHVPVYGRVIIRDVNTLEPVENGKKGLISLITPMNRATPVLNVMTDDIGVLHDASECGCGINSPFFEIKGRVGLKEIKTCAAGAAEILSGALKK